MLMRHWSLSPLLPLALVVAAVHALGLVRRSTAISRAHRPVWPWILQGLLFDIGLTLLVVAIDSPLDYYAGRSLTAHMLQHILLGFGAPALVALGAPWLPLMSGLPRGWRRRVGRVVQALRRWQRRARWTRHVTHPAVPIVGFNLAMVGWHLPAAYDLAQRNELVHIWLEHASFFGLALLLWMQLVGSYPFRPALPPLGQASVAFATNVVMVGTAMTLVLFTHDLYPVYHAVVGASLSQDADQQIAGSVLWVCGEATLAPLIYYQLHRWLAAGERTATLMPTRGTAIVPRWRAATGRQWK